MNKVPSAAYTQIIRALQRDGWTVVRQRGSHIRLQKRVGNEVLKAASVLMPKETGCLCRFMETVLLLFGRSTTSELPYYNWPESMMRRIS